ncbi:GntR family transcriptional regulator [Streptomyces sp. ME19-01-6]|uniref:GntR family transcriptional regulator n=1 Tax=Streptomyces sp. ME19-01-6 TaxID=3028686 RepID=UPI0029BC73A4|nr:GntR family transcriptional regulator [Streptomyces sp. ME19-01-6]MDX3224501.1 GntR family transcriptional regulator [Streptomyces sp. ME19-01-6]
MLTTKSQVIAAALRQQLTDGELPPEALSQSGLLARRFNVSPPVVRAAVKILTEDGVVAQTPSGYKIVPNRSATCTTPAVDRVQQHILENIATGQYKPGDLVPTGAALAQRLGVSTSTAANALSRLKDIGVLHGGPGKAGTRVAIPGQKRPPTTAERVKQLVAILQKQIADGTYPPGTLLPANRTLTAAHRVPEHVVFKAIKILVAEGLVESLGSIGKIVRDPKKAGERQLLSKPEQLIAALRRDILNGTLNPGDPLPSTPELARRYGMSQTSASKTLPKLLSEKIIQRARPGNTTTTIPSARQTSPQGRFWITSPDTWRQPPTSASATQESSDPGAARGGTLRQPPTHA